MSGHERGHHGCRSCGSASGTVDNMCETCRRDADAAMATKTLGQLMDAANRQQIADALGFTLDELAAKEREMQQPYTKAQERMDKAVDAVERQARSEIEAERPSWMEAVRAVQKARLSSKS